MKRLLIGYGNTTRSDDGAGIYAAEKMEKVLQDENVEIIKVQQLTVDLLNEICDASLVLFIDARQEIFEDSPEVEEGERLKLERIIPQENRGTFTHAMLPQTLLSMCERLYDRSPQAYVLSIKGRNFGFCEEISKEVRDAADRAAPIIQMLFTQIDNSSHSARC